MSKIDLNIFFLISTKWIKKILKMLKIHSVIFTKNDFKNIKKYDKNGYKNIFKIFKIKVDNFEKPDHP